MNSNWLDSRWYKNLEHMYLNSYLWRKLWIFMGLSKFINQEI
jgi:hypothetical protein